MKVMKKSVLKRCFNFDAPLGFFLSMPLSPLVKFFVLRICLVKLHKFQWHDWI